MRQTLIIIIVISFVTSCSNGRRPEYNGRWFVPPPIIINSELHESVEPIFIPDTAIGKISIENSKNVDEYLGDNIMDRLVRDGLPSSSLVSNDKKQQLTVYFHPGGTKKEFSEFKVRYIDNPDSHLKISSDKEFITESKIKLGISIDKLKAIKGKPNSLSKDGGTIFHYKIDDIENSKFLKKYNLPIYYADYKFKNGFLIEFRFGFEYP